MGNFREGPHHPREVQHLPLRGLQGASRKLAEAGDHGEWGGDGGGYGMGEHRTMNL